MRKSERRRTPSLGSFAPDLPWVAVTSPAQVPRASSDPVPQASPRLW